MPLTTASNSLTSAITLPPLTQSNHFAAQFVKTPKINYNPRKKTKGRSKDGKMAARKKGVRQLEQRVCRLGGPGPGGGGGGGGADELFMTVGREMSITEAAFCLVCLCTCRAGLGGVIG